MSHRLTTEEYSDFIIAGLKRLSLRARQARIAESLRVAGMEEYISWFQEDPRRMYEFIREKPTDILCSFCDQYHKEVFVAQCLGCSWCKFVCDACTQAHPTKTGKPLAEHILSLHKAICEKSATSSN